MRKNILHCSVTHGEATRAFYASKTPGKKYYQGLRINSPEVVHFFRTAMTLEQAQRLAGIAFSEINLTGEESAEAKQYLLGLLRHPATVQ